MLKRKKIIIGILLVFSIFLVTHLVQAQDFGLQEVDETINLSADDPRTIVGRIINFVLSFLGIISLGLIIYAGFLWMTSGGEEEKVRRAQSILKNAIIGLVIILSAWGITTFIISRLWGATQGGEVTVSPIGNNLSNNYGLGAIGSCSVESVYPENGQKDVARNTAIIMTFKEAVGLASACVNESGTSCACNNADCSYINPNTIRIFTENLGDACGDTCPEVNTNVSDVTVSVSSDQKTLVLTPLAYLGSADKKTDYAVKVTADLKKSNGTSMFASCSTNYLNWGFEVSTKLDLTPPQVVSRGLFPQPDNEADVFAVASAAQAANGEIFVKDCPSTFKAAEVISVSQDAQVSLNYHGNLTDFKVSVPADAPGRAQLFNAADNSSLGVADFDENMVVSFENYFSLKVESTDPGNLWEIKINPERRADSLKVGNQVYIFSDTGENNNIVVNEGNCDTRQQAANIQAKLSGHPDISVSILDNRVILQAKVANSMGNEIELATTNSQALELIPFTGGTDLESSYQVKDKRDTAMNTVIKITFNEPMNPINISGPAAIVSPFIKVVNARTDALSEGSACSLDNQCKSYNCEGSVCVGDYLNGTFMVSNNYRTVEFISDNECGINGCGEKVYCLPPSSQLAVELKAADLKNCISNQDCLGFTPFQTCALGALGYRTCQDNSQRNYPAADTINLNGATDVALNSLDGNRDTVVDGPLLFFNENTGDVNNRDSYRFSFFVNDQKNLQSPAITNIVPLGGQTGIVTLTTPVEISFNTLMMSSTLRSGGSILSSGTESVAHKLINLKSSQESPLGYWLTNKDLDTGALDGVVDVTIAEIQHSPFLEALSYNAQVGSGVKDIYQNCFKPSAGPGCEANWENPSCCFGVATGTLNENGDCN
ncbi:MAG: Ig-like domain-containing protein [Patescibacteria group bacterium]|nr:Ig-like domain-containing protein [Patescibacteria group bacterium]